MVTSTRERTPRRPWSVGTVLADPALRIPLVFFVVAELLDVLTTLSGLLMGLSEVNPVASSVLGVFGSFGLLIQKAAVVIAVTIAAALLPPRLAALTCWTFTLVMSAVVASNAALVLAAHAH